MLLLTVKSKAATLAVISMTAGTELRKKDTEDFCKNPCPNPNLHSYPQK